MSEDDLFNPRLSLIADPVNRRILDLLSDSSQYSEDLARKLGFSRSALEQRVARLMEAGFVRKLEERNSPRVVLVITAEAMRVRDWLQQLRTGGSPEEPRPEPPPSTPTTTTEEVAEPKPPKTRGLLERISLSLPVFLVLENIAIIDLVYNLQRGSWNWAVVGWVAYTVLGIIAAKFVAWLNRLLKERVKE